jgi:hypothetical protein
MLEDGLRMRMSRTKSIADETVAARSAPAVDLPTSARIGLLVTCAVTPHAAIKSSERSRTERLTAYRAGLASWRFFERFGPVVVCEGSSYPEARFRAEVGAIAPAPFEYLTTATSDASAQLGKGAAELDLMAYAVEHSRLLQRVDRVLKVTGRYAVLNGEPLARKLLEQETLPGIQVNLHDRLRHADPRVCLFSREFFSNWLLPRKGAIRDWPRRLDDEPIFLEHVLAQATLEYIAHGGAWDLLPLPLRLRGTSGTTGLPYEEGLARYAIRYAAHQLKSRALGRRPAWHRSSGDSPGTGGASSGSSG